MKRYLFKVTDEYGDSWFESASGYDRNDAAERLYDRIEMNANPGYRFNLTYLQHAA